MGIFSWRNKPKQKAASDGEMSFLDHLEELRWHLVRSLGVVLVIGIVVFIYRKPVMDDIIFGPYRTDFYTNKTLAKVTTYLDEVTAEWDDAEVEEPPANEEELLTAEEAAAADDGTPSKWVKGLGVKGDKPFQALSPYEQFLKSLTIAVVGGIIVGFPYIAWEIWRFIRPGLTSREIKKARGFVFFLSLLFFAGVSFGYWIISPLAVQFLASFEVSELVTNQWRFDEAVTMVVRLALAAGLLFELPLATYFLARIGILTSDFMRKHRKHAAVILLIVSAIITPPDWITQVLIFIPLAGLYEVSIWVAKRVEKNDEKDRLADKEKEDKDAKPEPA